MTHTDPPAEPHDSDRAEAESGLVLLALQAEAADPSRPESGWLKRRVEQLEFLDTRAVRWRVSIDFEVPGRAPTARIGTEEFRLVPVTTLPKGDLVAFDLRDERGRALWMPTAEEINRKVAPAIVTWARVILRVRRLPGSMELELMRIVALPPRAHASAYRLYAAAAARIEVEQLEGELEAALQDRARDHPWRIRARWLASRRHKRARNSLEAARTARREIELRLGQVGDDVTEAAYRLMNYAQFRSQLEELARNYVVYVGLASEPGTRRIVKLTSERSVDFWARGSLGKRVLQRLGWRCWPVDVLIGGRGGSHHLEVAAPHGVDIVEIVARPNDPAEQSAAKVTQAGLSPHVHIHIPRESPFRYRATIYVRVSRTGWLGASLFVGVVIAVVMLMGRLKLAVLFQSTAGMPADAGTAATLLLALLGVIASWLTRPGEHPLAARLLALVRRLIMVDVASVLIGTGDLVLHRTTHLLPTALWSGLAWTSGVIAVLIGVSWVAPVTRPGRSE